MSTDHCLTQLEATIQHLDAELATTRQQLNMEQGRVQALQQQLNAAPQPPVPQAPPPRPSDLAATPANFEGKFNNTDRFLHQCSLYFASGVWTNEQQINFALSHMTAGRALSWAQQRLAGGIVGVAWATIEGEIRATFGDPNQVQTARMALLNVRQGERRFEEYLVDFDLHANLTGYNPESLETYLKQGMNPNLKKAVYTSFPAPTNYAEWRACALAIDHSRCEGEQMACTSGSRPPTQQTRNVLTPFRAATAQWTSGPVVKKEPVEQSLASVTCFNCNGKCHNCGSWDWFGLVP
jgi:hypothetical protein